MDKRRVRRNVNRLKIMFFHTAIKRRSGQPECLCRMRYIEAVFLQRSMNRILLQLVQIENGWCIRKRLLLSRRRAVIELQIVGRQDVSLGKDNRALNGVP